MTKPTVHLNGTSRSDLLKGYADAFHAISEALEVVAQARPNARDYYVQGDNAYRQAAAEHAAREAKLRDVRDELSALHDAVVDA